MAVTHPGFGPPTLPHLLASIPPEPRNVPDTQKRGTPRSPRAPRPAVRDPRAPSSSRAGQTSTPCYSRRRRHLSETPQRGRRDRWRPPLPCWRGKEKAPRFSGTLPGDTNSARALGSSRRGSGPRWAAQHGLGSGREATREPIQTRFCRGAVRHFRDPRGQERAARASEPASCVRRGPGEPRSVT